MSGCLSENRAATPSGGAISANDATAWAQVMRISVGYTVPVACEVDTETGEVLGVTILGELIARDGSFWDEHGQTYEGAVTDRAQDIAESQTWPAWDRR